MKRLSKKAVERYQRILKANRVEELELPSSQGPLGMLALEEEVRTRLRSTGGRPTIPDWDIKRPIPLRSCDWRKLQERGKQIGLTPAQCAALLIEKALEMLEEAEQQERDAS